MTRPLLRFFLFCGVAALTALPSPALACAACFGASDDAQAKGMNAGIFSLLVVVLFMLTGIASFFIYHAKRSATLAAAAPEALTPTTNKA